MSLPESHSWPHSLRSADAVDQLARQLDAARSIFNGVPVRNWFREVPFHQRQLYLELALRLMDQLGSPIAVGEDRRLTNVANQLARMLQVIK